MLFKCVCVCTQAIKREDQVVRLQAEIVALRGDVEARCAQLESGDEALTALSRRLRDTQRELELSHAHAQECELVIDALRDSVATLRSQVRTCIGDLQLFRFGIEASDGHETLILKIGNHKCSDQSVF